MVQVKILQKIAFLIVMSAYVKSIRNSVSPDDGKSPDDKTSIPSSPPMLTFPDSVTTDQNQSFSAFRPSHLLDFTEADVLDSPANIEAENNIHKASTQSLIPQNSHVARTRLPPKSRQTQAKLSFPNANDYEHHQRQYQVAPLNKHFHEFNTAHILPNEILEEKSEFQSAPGVTRLDPNTDSHYSGPDENVVEYTVHSSMQVQSPHTATYQRNPPSQPLPLSLSSPPSHSLHPFGDPSSHQQFLEASQLSEFSYNYNNVRPSHSHNPNVAPDHTNRKLWRVGASPTSPALLSQASKDFASPSYFQHSNNRNTPQRQNYSPVLTLAPSASSPSSLTIPNYSQSYPNNYLHSPVLYESQHQEPQRKPSDNYYHTLTFSPSLEGEADAGPNGHLASYQILSGSGFPLPSAPHLPNNKNYYSGYQLGEIPPSDTQHFRPPLSSFGSIRPPLEQPQEAAGIASVLPSLFSSAQSFTPQLSNLGNLIGAFTGVGAISSSRPINAQLVKALESIARNDDLQCVPKVLCQLIAGQTQRGQLPSFVTSPAITRFLAAFPASSPALVFGRAGLLGISGGVPSCVQTYAKCPKREDEILYYLNNHRGGFFKLFSEPKPEPQKPEQSSSTSSLLNIWSLLVGDSISLSTTPRPTKTETKPTPVSTNITSNIANFFTNLLSTYMNGIDNQRRRRRVRRTIYNTVGDSEQVEEEETDDGENDDDENNPQHLGVQSRILHKNLVISKTKGPNFFPQTENSSQFPRHFIRKTQSNKPKFPIVTNKSKRERQESVKHLFLNFLSNSIASETVISNLKNKKRVCFYDDDNNHDQDQDGEDTNLASIVVTDPKRGVRMIYTGDIDEIMRRGRILNGHIHVTNYDGFEQTSEKNNKLVVSDQKRLPYPRPIPSAALVQRVHGHGDYPWLSHKNKNRNMGHSSPGSYQSTYQGYRSPSLHSREEDKNIYVTDAKGLNEYYITPDGRKVYT